MAGTSGFEYRDNTEHFDGRRRGARLTAYDGWVLGLFGDGVGVPGAGAGAGSGHFAGLLRRRGRPLLLLEGGTDNLATLERRFGDDAGVEIVDCDLNACQD